MTYDKEFLKGLQEARRKKAQWYHQTLVNLSNEYSIAVCEWGCDCRGFGKVMGHSRAHAHTKERKICLRGDTISYQRFVEALHEIGHIVHPRADYNKGYTRAEAEHNATEWAYAEMRKLGLPIKRKVKAKYDWYIGNKIARGLRRGLKVVPPVLRKYRVV